MVGYDSRADSERGRLAALQRYAILDTPPESTFDSLTGIAAQMFDSPMAWVSLIDRDRQWFKSRFGLSVGQTSRDIAFCDQTVHDMCAFVVPDAAHDPRFADNPLVTGPPYIRFYAGCPLTTIDRFAIGSLAIADTEPRMDFGREEVRRLEQLAEIAIETIELRHHAATNELLQQAVIHAKDGILVTRPCRDAKTGSEIEYANAAFGQLTGYAAETLTGTHTGRFYGPATDERALAESFEKLETGEPYRVEYCIHLRDGTAVPVEVSGGGIKDSRGSDTHWISIWRDMSERRRLEASLVEAKKKADRASAVKSRFLANMSHELRTPLNAVIGFSEMVLDAETGTISPEKHRAYVENVLLAGKTLLSFVDDLFDLARLEAGGLEISSQWIEWSGVVTEALNLLTPEIEKSGVSVRRTDPSESCLVKGDSRALCEVLTNVLGNAMKYSSSGDVITLTSRRTVEGDLEVVVEDNGIGMSRDEVDKALEPFERAGNPYNASVSGLGLGLPISKQLIELHGGTLAIRSSENRGTTVTLRLAGSCVSNRAECR